MLKKVLADASRSDGKLLRGEVRGGWQKIKIQYLEN